MYRTVPNSRTWDGINHHIRPQSARKLPHLFTEILPGGIEHCMGSALQRLLSSGFVHLADNHPRSPQQSQLHMKIPHNSHANHDHRITQTNPSFVDAVNTAGQRFGQGGMIQIYGRIKLNNLPGRNTQVLTQSASLNKTIEIHPLRLLCLIDTLSSPSGAIHLALIAVGGGENYGISFLHAYNAVSASFYDPGNLMSSQERKLPCPGSQEYPSIQRT